MTRLYSSAHESSYNYSTLGVGGCRVFSTLANFKIYAPASINVNVNGPVRSYYEEGIPENTHIDAESTKTIFE